VLQFYTNGRWNDLRDEQTRYGLGHTRDSAHTLRGYVVEYGGYSGDPSISSSAGAVVVATTTFSIDRVNDAPTFTGITNISYTENESAKSIAASGVINDVDNSANFESGYIQAEYRSGSENSDQLSILETGSITRSGSTISYSGTAIGTVDATLNGVHGQALRITLNSSATKAASQALLRSIAYSNTSDDPSSGLSNNDRVVRITFDDGGNTSGITRLRMKMHR